MTDTHNTDSSRFCFRLLVMLALAGMLTLPSGCGGSKSGDAAAPAPTPPVASVFAAQEPVAVADTESVYAVEEVAKVINATITTFDGAYTFAQVNSDIDAYDAFVPEVDAHFAADDYPDDGLTVNSKIRLRGKSSRLAAQKSYRLKLSKNLALWRGETTLQLNKHPWDLSRVRNKLAFDLFREIPHLPSLRTQFMHLTVNGEDYGLFTHVEKMGKEYLSRRGLATDGNIYKANDFTFRNVPALSLDGTGYPLDIAAFEGVLELENDNRNYALLAAMTDAVNDETQPFDALFSKYFDSDNYLTWLAVNILVGNYDSINQNFALYQPKDSTKFYFLPWDYDGAFGQENQPDFALNHNLYAPWQLGLGNWWGVPLHRRFMQDPRHLRDLRQAVEEVYSKYLTSAKIKAHLDAYKTQVEPLISKSPDYDNLPTLTSAPKDEWVREYDRLVTTVKNNYDLFNSSLEKPKPFWQSAAVAGDQLQLSWDESVDLQKDTVSYSVQVADNPQFAPALYSSTGFDGLSKEIPVPRKGIYYLRVIAKDSKGNISEGFDRFDQGTTSYFGVLRFEVP